MTFQPFTPVNAGIHALEREKQKAESIQEELEELRCDQEHCVEKEIFVRAMKERGVIQDDFDEVLVRGIANQKDGEKFVELFNEI